IRYRIVTGVPTCALTISKEFYGWGHDLFHVPDEVYQDFHSKIVEKGKQEEQAWNEMLEAYSKKYPKQAAELKQAMNEELPDGWDNELPDFEPGKDHLATRASSGKILNALSASVPNLFGGSADLAGSNKTSIEDMDDFSKDNYAGKNIWFGV